MTVAIGAAEPAIIDQLTESPGDTTYFIDPVNGDDSNPLGKPWKSFRNINALKLAPGDQVVIAPGRQEETFKPSGEGTLQKPIRVRFLPGVHVIGTQSVIRLSMFVSNSMDSEDPKPIGILLQNVRHFRIEGSGVEGPGKTMILYDGRMVQIFNDHAEDITFTGLVFDLKRPTVSEFRVVEVGPTQAIIQVAEGSAYAVENGKFTWQGDWGARGCIAQEAIPEEGRCWRRGSPPGWNGQGQVEATATELGDRKVRLDFGAKNTGLSQGHQYQFRNAFRDRVGVHDVLDNITWYPNLTARNNHISMDPVRGFLLTTRGKVVIEGNTFHRCAMPAILVENDAEGWFESGPVRDMLLRSNQFIGCGISINPQTKSSKPEEPVHENIRIMDNFFDGAGVEAKNVRGLTVTGNRTSQGPLQVRLAPSCTKTKVENNSK